MSLTPDAPLSHAKTDHGEEKFRLLLETNNEAVFEVDSTGVVTYISSGIQKNIGYSPEEVIGRPFIGFIWEEDRQRILDRFANWPAVLSVPASIGCSADAE